MPYSPPTRTVPYQPFHEIRMGKQEDEVSSFLADQIYQY